LRKKEVSRRKNIFIGKTYSFHKLFSGRFLTLISGVRQNGNASTLFPGRLCHRKWLILYSLKFQKNNQ
jgi:hypothetical protein